MLLKAGIKVSTPDYGSSHSRAIQIWVLTGDKKETAINIGYACKILSDQLSECTLDEASIDVRSRTGERRDRSLMLIAGHTK